MAMPGAISMKRDAWPRTREEALRDRPEEGGVLGLQRVEEDVSSGDRCGPSDPQSFRELLASRPVSDSMALVGRDAGDVDVAAARRRGRRGRRRPSCARRPR